MENEKIIRIKKAAGVTSKVLNVIRIVLIVGTVLCLVGGTLTMCIRQKDSSVELFGKSIVVHNLITVDGSIGNGSLSVTGFDVIERLGIEDPCVKAGLNCFVAAFLCGLALFAVIVLRDTFGEIEKSDTPFKQDILKKIRLTGIIITAITLSSSIGIAAIVGLAFWCIYCIFDYGTELQKEADETL